MHCIDLCRISDIDSMESVVQSYDLGGSNIADVVANSEWFIYRSIYVSVWRNLSDSLYLAIVLSICLTESIWLNLNRSVPVSVVIPPCIAFLAFFFLAEPLLVADSPLPWLEFIHPLELYTFKKTSICWFFVQDVKKHKNKHTDTLPLSRLDKLYKFYWLYLEESSHDS